MPTRGAEVFFDTNILLYLVSAEPLKAAVAEALLAQGGHVSVQVLNEFASVARRKAGLAWEEIADILGVVRRLCTVWPLTVDTHQGALELAARDGVGFYDAAIVAAALEAQCRVLYSEDLQHGRRFGRRLTIRNPFRPGTRP